MTMNHPRISGPAPVARERGSSPEPLTESTVSLNIAGHREELLRINPGAVELAAQCIFAFHEDINGSLTTVLASRAGSYAREQGTGKRSLTVEDLCEMVTKGGSEGRSAVRALLAPIVDRLDGVTASGIAIGDAVADFDNEAGDITQAIIACQAKPRLWPDSPNTRPARGCTENARSRRAPWRSLRRHRQPRL